MQLEHTGLEQRVLRFRCLRGLIMLPIRMPVPIAEQDVGGAQD